MIDTIVGFLFAGPLIVVMWAGAARLAWWLWHPEQGS